MLHAFLSSALDEGEWSASRSGCFTPRGSTAGTHCIGAWVGPRAGLDAVAKGKNLSPCRELNPSHSARRLVTDLTELPFRWRERSKVGVTLDQKKFRPTTFHVNHQ